MPKIPLWILRRPPWKRSGRKIRPARRSLYAGISACSAPTARLPLCLTEYARDRILHHGDPTFAAFCNVFHHRLLSFFFRAWADARKTVDFDRPTDEHWSQYIGSLVGLGMDSLHKRDSLPDCAKMYYAGRFVQQNRNADGLAAVIEDFFGIVTEVQTFVGRWIELNGDGRDSRQNYICQAGAFARNRPARLESDRGVKFLDVPDALPPAHGANEAAASWNPFCLPVVHSNVCRIGCAIMPAMN